MFTFDLTVSDQGFERKPQDKKEYAKITFTQQNVTLMQMTELISDGRLFSGVYNDTHFNIKYKTKDNYVSTNVIPIDIDDCDCSMRDFMTTLEYSPTIAYETFSNLQDGKGYRFRFLYVFKETIEGGENYALLYDAICKANHIEGKGYNDNHSSSCVQKYWGTSKNNDIVPIGLLYSFSSFSSFMDGGGVSRNSSKEKDHQSNKVSCGIPLSFVDKTFEKYWNTKTDIDILTDMRCYQSEEQTLIDWNDGELWRDLEDTDFYEIKRRWTTKLVFNGGRYKKIPTNRLLKNGQHRRNKIFTSLMRRRLIDPTLTIENLCWAALYELYFFIQNTDKDDYITRQQLWQIAESAYNTDMDKFKEKLKEDKHFKVNKIECYKQGLDVQKVVGMANGKMRTKRKMERYETYKKYYDKDLTDRENIKILEDNGIKPPTLNRYRMFRRECFPKIEEETTDMVHENNNTKEINYEIQRLFKDRLLENCVRNSKTKSRQQMPIMWMCRQETTCSS